MKRNDDRNRAVFAMRREGKTLREIAKVFKISHERVRQLLLLEKQKDTELSTDPLQHP